MRRAPCWPLACLLAAAAAASTPLVGGDADAHGCIASAGYTYCEPLGKCIRSWESTCVELEEETTKGDEKESKKKRTRKTRKRRRKSESSSSTSSSSP